MTVVVVATIRPLPDHHAEVVSALEAAIARVHAEDEGCLLYALQEGPDRLVMVEKWSSAEALDKHAHGAAVAALNQAGLGPRLCQASLGSPDIGWFH